VVGRPRLYARAADSDFRLAGDLDIRVDDRQDQLLSCSDAAALKPQKEAGLAAAGS